jgi:hypothetical protein
MKNLISLEEYSLYENELENASDYDFIDDDDELSEAIGRKLTPKEIKRRQQISAVMKKLNKDAQYAAAKEKFLKLFRKKAREVVKELGYDTKVLKQVQKSVKVY